MRSLCSANDSELFNLKNNVALKLRRCNGLADGLWHCAQLR